MRSGWTILSGFEGCSWPEMARVALSLFALVSLQMVSVFIWHFLFTLY